MEISGKRILLISTCLIIFITLFIAVVCFSNDDVVIKEHNYIAHAGGIIEGYPYTNSKEAVEHAIACGINYIELDLNLTSDSMLVAVHDWNEFYHMATITPPLSKNIDKQTFIKSKIYDKFTPLTADGIVDILKEHPELTLVTDKISDPRIIHPYFKDFTHRVVVECFSDSDYYTLSQLGYKCFRSEIPQFWGLYYLKKLLTLGRYNIDKYVTWFGFYDWRVRRYFGRFPPPKCEMAIFTIKDRMTADSIFAVYPNVSLIYVDDIELP